MLSPYALVLAKKLNVKYQSKKIPKLIPNFADKTNYVVHYRNLQFYISMGMEVVKIHKILEFEQSRWLKPYIDFNTSKRQAATSSFEKDLFKLMNNSVYGKTMQNDRKHLNVHIVTSELHAKRLIARPTLQSFKIINEDVAIVKLMKSSVLLNKPIYVGMCILDLSKLSIIMCLCKSTAIGRSCFSPIQIASATMSKRTISIKTWGKTAAAISCSATIMLR